MTIIGLASDFAWWVSTVFVVALGMFAWGWYRERF